MYEDLKEQARAAAAELVEAAGLQKGNIVVVGCSRSEEHTCELQSQR